MGSGFVDSRGDQPPYQCTGIERGPVCTENICPGSAESACSHEIRQQDCSRIYPKNGRNTFRMHGPYYTGDMEVRSRQANSPVHGEPGSLNSEADWKSRNYQDSSDWQLKKCLFQQLNNQWGPFKLDLFVSRHNTQLEHYVSWILDPYAQAVDAFQLPWTKEGLYLFPPFAMNSRCLMKVRQDKTSVVLIAPPWQTQPWFPNLLSLLVDNQILLPPYKDILLSPKGQVHPLAHQSRFRLGASPETRPCPGDFRTGCQAAGNTFLEERHNHRLQQQLEIVV